MPRTVLACAAALYVAQVGATDECCWCDSTTPKSAYTITDSEAKAHTLVFSDEFNTPGRKFANGEDPKWTALEIGDTSNQGAAFYLPSQAMIADDLGESSLLILTENASHTGDSPTGEKGIFMPFRSAMLQSWNKFCFTGGIVEFRARQPRGAGYWPALWLFGNLGRAVYQDSNTGLWPWSYDQCDPDLKLPPTDPTQRISACDSHDLETDGLHAYQGRGATELDVLEGAVTNGGTNSYVVGSLQLSPGVPPFFRPPLFDFPTKSGPGAWYNGLSFGPPIEGLASGGFPNNGWYGPPWGADCPTGCPDALSGGFVELDDLDTRYWTYRLEWKTGPNGHLAWYYDGAFVWAMAADAFGEYSVCSDRNGVKECSRTPARQIPEEPMSIVMNTAIGSWNGGKSALDGKHWPAKFFVDYVRVWQETENVGCNPPNYPTKKYIDNHALWYGEPAAPSGYDTCPEKYPPSAYTHADELKARKAAGGKGTAQDAETFYTADLSRMNAGRASASGVLGSWFAAGAVPAATTAPAAQPSSSVPMGSVIGAAVLAVGIAAGFVAGRRQHLPSLSGMEWPRASAGPINAVDDDTADLATSYESYRPIDTSIGGYKAPGLA